MDFSNNSEWDINSWITPQTLTPNNTAALSRPLQTRTPSLSGSDPDTTAVRRRNVVTNGRVSKRKSRPSKKSMTTVINADPANFKQMVQQVTGVSVVPLAPLLRPEPQRFVNRVQGSWPTLDSSASMPGQPHQQLGVGPTCTVPLGGYDPAMDVDVSGGGAGGFSYESFDA